ncbi:MAG TPA: pyridoxamine 5'-phosphate oxidase family protein, partial [Caulobacteraceae bacterium]|nr:pyridoxamine 5'-phosphate oxidase family protein [Caulobacteraceae bacterium]
PALAPTVRTSFGRKAMRGAYELAAINAVLDAAMICQIGYVADGQPKVLPTIFWREGDAVYWHGSRESGAIKAMAGAEVCFTVTLLDALVLAKSAFAHSANYRSVMAYGRSEPISGEAEKATALKAMIGRIHPGRWPQIRPPSRAELAATSVLRLALTEATAKSRTGPPLDIKPDPKAPAWTGVIPLKTHVGEPELVGILEPDAEGPQSPAWLVG